MRRFERLCMYGLALFLCSFMVVYWTLDNMPIHTTNSNPDIEMIVLNTIDSQSDCRCYVSYFLFIFPRYDEVDCSKPSDFDIIKECD